MATPAWKWPGSKIGKTGPRNANPAYKRRSREPWTAAELRKLKQLAKGSLTSQTSRAFTEDEYRAIVGSL